jgi:hypothetical protein
MSGTEDLLRRTLREYAKRVEAPQSAREIPNLDAISENRVSPQVERTPPWRQWSTVAAITVLVSATIGILVFVSPSGDRALTPSDSAGTAKDTSISTAGEDSPVTRRGASVKLNLSSANSPFDMNAMANGRLESDRQGCVFVRLSVPGGGSQDSDLIWPPGFGVVQLGPDGVGVTDSQRNIVAEIGHPVSLGGGALAKASLGAQIACEATNSRTIFRVDSWQQQD